MILDRAIVFCSKALAMFKDGNFFVRKLGDLLGRVLHKHVIK